jgi:hypothetical protein
MEEKAHRGMQVRMGEKAHRETRVLIPERVAIVGALLWAEPM